MSRLTIEILALLVLYGAWLISRWSEIGSAIFLLGSFTYVIAHQEVWGAWLGDSNTAGIVTVVLLVPTFFGVGSLLVFGERRAWRRFARRHKLDVHWEREDEKNVERIHGEKAGFRIEAVERSDGECTTVTIALRGNDPSDDASIADSPSHFDGIRAILSLPPRLRPLLERSQARLVCSYPGPVISVEPSQPLAQAPMACLLEEVFRWLQTLSVNLPPCNLSVRGGSVDFVQDAGWLGWHVSISPKDWSSFDSALSFEAVNAPFMDMESRRQLAARRTRLEHLLEDGCGSFFALGGRVVESNVRWTQDHALFTEDNVHKIAKALSACMLVHDEMRSFRELHARVMLEAGNVRDFYSSGWMLCRLQKLWRMSDFVAHVPQGPFGYLLSFSPDDAAEYFNELGAHGTCVFLTWLDETERQVLKGYKNLRMKG